MRLIDADALKKVFHAEWDGVLVWDEGGETTADEFCNLVDAVPTIEAEPVKHGRWIVVSDGYGNGDATAHICECSECKDTIWVYKKATRRWNYCPNCGAKMDLGGEAHDQN